MTATILPGLRDLAVPIESLRPMPGNPHHGDVPALCRSWGRFGQRRPLIGRKDAKGGGGIIIAGNHGLEAARELGWSHVAVLWVDDDDVTAKAFAAADNHTAELGSDDPELLAEWLMSVRVEDQELFDATSFDLTDVARLLDPTGGNGARVSTGDRGESERQTLESSWAVIVTLDDEAAQLALLERLSEEGFDCRALIS
jgi:ParB-like chromosome segregation protein Spo0J